MGEARHTVGRDLGSAEPAGSQKRVASRRAERRAFVLVCLLLVWAGFLENLSFGLRFMSGMPESATDLLGLAGFALIGAATCYVVYMLRSAVLLRRLMLSGIMLLIFSQVVDTLDEVAALQIYPFLAKGHWLHEISEHFAFSLGALALVCGALLAIIQGEAAARLMVVEQLPAFIKST